MNSKLIESIQLAKKDNRKIKEFLKLSNEKIFLTIQI